MIILDAEVLLLCLENDEPRFSILNIELGYAYLKESTHHAYARFSDSRPRFLAEHQTRNVSLETTSTFSGYAIDDAGAASERSRARAAEKRRQRLQNGTSA